MNSASKAAEVKNPKSEIFPCLRIMKKIRQRESNFMRHEKIFSGGEKLNHYGE